MNGTETDHDLLIKINTKLNGLCEQFSAGKKDNKEDHEKMQTSFENRDNKKLPSRVFYFMLPFIILGLMGVATLASSNHYSLGKIETALELHMDKKAAEKKEIKIGETTDAVTKSIIIHKQR